MRFTRSLGQLKKFGIVPFISMYIFILHSGFQQRRAALLSYKLMLTYSELCFPAFSHENKSDTLYKRMGIKRMESVKEHLPWQPRGTLTDLLWPLLSLPTLQKPISHGSHCDTWWETKPVGPTNICDLTLNVSENELSCPPSQSKAPLDTVTRLRRWLVHTLATNPL